MLDVGQTFFELTFSLLSLLHFELEMVPVRGYEKECSPENVEFLGIAA